VALDLFATMRIGGAWAPECEVLRLHHVSAEVFGLKAEASVFCLRVADGLPQGVVTVEMKPGCGLMELYGQPGLYHMQDESLLRSAEMAKGGRYSAPDIFSGRKDRVLRALEALNLQGQSGDARLQVLVEDRVSTVADASEFLQLGGTTDGQTTRSPLLQLVAQLLDSRGEAASGLLPGILRAQCAGEALNASCAQLNEILKSRSSVWRPTLEDMETALKRGYWSLPADQSGLHLREREAERLLDRAKRELWQEGSTSCLGNMRKPIEMDDQ